MRGRSCGDFSLWSLQHLAYGDAPHHHEGKHTEETRAINSKAETKDKDGV